MMSVHPTLLTAYPYLLISCPDYPKHTRQIQIGQKPRMTGHLRRRRIFRKLVTKHPVRPHLLTPPMSTTSTNAACLPHESVTCEKLDGGSRQGDGLWCWRSPSTSPAPHPSGGVSQG